MPTATGQIQLTPALAASYVKGGHGKFTLVGRSSRYTFKEANPIKDGKVDHSMIFIKTLIGANNENDYAYIGYIKLAGDGKLNFQPGKKGNPAHPAYKALQWYLSQLEKPEYGKADEASFYHEGVCARCGRTLTAPESIELGYGPECAKHI